MTTRFLPPGMRCTAYWYAWMSGTLTGGGPADPEDMDFLLEMGRRAAWLARWYGYPPDRVPEGPLTVHRWPEHVWDEVVTAMAAQAAETGDWHAPRHGYWEAGDYG